MILTQEARAGKKETVYTITVSDEEILSLPPDLMPTPSLYHYIECGGFAGCIAQLAAIAYYLEEKASEEGEAE